jgi:Membrane transporters of cations and cationic drugs
MNFAFGRVNVEYLFLAVAIVGELVGTTFIAYSQGFTKPLPSVVCTVAYCISFYFFSKALLNINLSIAYATWCGVGIVVSTLISVLIFKQAISAWGVMGIVLIVIGTVLINLFGTPAVK